MATGAGGGPGALPIFCMFCICVLHISIGYAEPFNKTLGILYQIGTDYHFSFDSVTEDENRETVATLSAEIVLRCKCDMGSAWSFDFIINDVEITGMHNHATFSAELSRSLSLKPAELVLGKHGKVRNILFHHEGASLHSLPCICSHLSFKILLWFGSQRKR